LACDAEVLAALDGDERRDYGHALLDQVQCGRSAAWSPGLAGVLEGTTTVERRIAMIAAFRAPTWSNAAAGLALLLLLGATALTDAKAPIAATNNRVALAAKSIAEYDSVAADALAADVAAMAAESDSGVAPPAAVHMASTAQGPTELLDLEWRKIALDADTARRPGPGPEAIASPRAADSGGAQTGDSMRQPVKTAKVAEPMGAPPTGKVASASSSKKEDGRDDTATRGTDTGVKRLAKDTSSEPFVSSYELAEVPPSRIWQKLESNLSQQRQERRDTEVTSAAESVAPARSEGAARTPDGAERETKARPKKIRDKIGATWRSVRNVLGGDGSKGPVGRGDRFDPAFVGSIVGPAANGGNSSLIPAAEPAGGVAVTMSFTRPSLRSIPKVEWGFAEGVGTRSAS
jgi:hypothetical protein